MIFQFTSWKCTLGDIERSNQGHWISSGLYVMLWPEFIWNAYVLELLLTFSIPYDCTSDFIFGKLFTLIGTHN